MFDEFEKKKYHNYRPPPDLSKFILVEERDIQDFKCGECNGIVHMSIYYSSSPSRYIKHFKCSNCDLETWR